MFLRGRVKIENNSVNLPESFRARRAVGPKKRSRESMKEAEIEPMGQRPTRAWGTLPPVVYHMAEAVNWPSIERAGLLSARALLELAGVPEAERGQVDLEQRTGPLLLPGGMVIRDQKPMPPAALERCLHGMTPAQWYALLNSQVFFWLDIERLN